LTFFFEGLSFRAKFSSWDNTEKLIALLGNTTSPMPAAVHGHDEKIQQASIAHLLALTNLVEN
jgi:hypothetical protein